MLSAPLGEEQIETTFTRDGKRVTEIVEIGKRIELFQKSVEKDEAKLKDYWKQWEELQDDFVELGIEVFGPEVFGKAAKEAREKGFRREMELLDREHDARVLELTGEVEDVAEKFLEKMTESEKVCWLYGGMGVMEMLTWRRGWMPVIRDNRRSFFRH